METQEPSYRLLRPGEVIKPGDQAYTWIDPETTVRGWIYLYPATEIVYIEDMVPVRRWDYQEGSNPHCDLPAGFYFCLHSKIGVEGWWYHPLHNRSWGGSFVTWLLTPVE